MGLPNRFFALVVTLGMIATIGPAPVDAAVAISGELRRWHPVTLTIDGPTTSEGAIPNPFLDYRFEVIFSHPASGLSYRVPGYFAADGDAGNTSAESGTQWRAHLSPDLIGTWTYEVVFAQGTNAAIGGPLSGTPLAPYNGATGAFTIEETNKTGSDFRARGRLEYVGRHHLRFKGDGSSFLKVGTDSPENLLNYEDFDNTSAASTLRKTWQPHQQDYVPGDPTWQNGKGTELIGAVNYLAAKGINAMSFIPYTFNGDDKNVFPHRTGGDFSRMDCSKLDQWGVVFAHMQSKGIYIHFKTQETENDQDMDGGDLGPQRKLYYRELVARFGHHLAVSWNLGEENTNTIAQRRDFTQWFYDNDPYRHLVVIQAHPTANAFPSLLGNLSKLSGLSIYADKPTVFADTLTWRANSAAALRPWVIAVDEQTPANDGILTDANDPNHDGDRADVLLGNIMAGGAGIEAYFGYLQSPSDLNCQDFRPRERWWDLCRFAVDFFRQHQIPIGEMANADALVSGSGPNANHCLALAGQTYVVYLRAGGVPTLDLSGATGSFEVRCAIPGQVDRSSPGRS